ncbi:autotransporter domain-containing protein [Xanthobacteraceae bacterium A53D]
MVRRSLVATFSLALLSSTALAQTAGPVYTGLWSLGDSLTDVGRTYERSSALGHPAPVGPPYADGRFSNGQVWVEYLSQLNGLPYVKAQNLAWGGAVTGSYYSLELYAITHLGDQVRQFRNGVTGKEFSSWSFMPWTRQTPRQASSAYGANPLITITIGGNNFRQYVEDNPVHDAAHLQKEVNAVKEGARNAVRDMQSAIGTRPDIALNGATYYVWTVADVSTTPKFSGLDPAFNSELSAGVKAANRGLKENLYKLGDDFAKTSPNSRIVVVDAAAFLAEVQADPTAFGFVIANQNCVASATGAYVNGCSAANVGDYLFWDEFHPTTKAHEMIAHYAQTTDWLEYGAAVSLTQPYVANIEIRDRTFAGTIDGTGSIIKQGESTLTLAGQNSYAGGTRIDQGAVRVFEDTNLGAASGLLTLNGGAISAGASFTMQRNVQFNATGGTLDAGAGTVFTLTGTLLGDGALTKTGAGMVDLRGTMASAADGLGLTEAPLGLGRQLTTVAAGTLKINTTNPYLTYRMEVQEGAVLGGAGRIIFGAPDALSPATGGGLFVSGILAPGNSIGTLTIEGDVTFTDSGRYHMEVDNGAADHLLVTGTMNLDGHVHIVTDSNDKLTNQSFVVASAADGISGTYDSVGDRSPFLHQTLSYSSNQVMVHFARDFTTPAATANQRTMGTVLNALYRPTDQGDLDDMFFGLDTTETDAGGRRALDQLSGAAIGNLTTSGAIQRGQFTRALEDRMAERRAGRASAASGTDAAALAFGPDSSGLAGAMQDASAALARMQPTAGGPAGDDGVSAWARVMGGPGHVGGTAGYDLTTAGVLLGLDKAFGFGLAGISVGYGTFDNSSDLGGSSSADSYQLSLYGSLQSGNLFLDGTLAYAYTNYELSRSLAFGTFARTATAAPNGNDVSLSLKAGGTYAVGGLAVEPSLGFDWYHLSRGAFTEAKAGTAGLMVDSQTLDLIMPSVGVRVASALDAGAFTLTPELSARYYYNFGDTGVRTSAALIGAPALPFSVVSSGFGHNLGVLSAALSAQQADDLRVSTRYELQVGDALTAQVFALDLKYTW